MRVVALLLGSVLVFACSGGAVGSQGPKGDTGSAGPKGDKGADGSPGPQGDTGLAGLPGEHGAVGATGPTGPQGPKGDTGSAGTNGAPGTNGQAGGSVTVVALAAGADENCPSGGSKLTGPDGKVTYACTGASVSAIATLGPNDANCPHGGVQYQTGGGQNQYVCNGADGASGGTGATGPKGVDGTNGTNGADGINGAPGMNGTNGMNGAPGANGMNGAPGANGMNGAPGSNGVSVIAIAIPNNPQAPDSNCPTGGTKLTAGDGTVTYACNGAPGVPTGAIMPFAGSVAPAGWLLCDGSALDTTQYAALFAAIASTYGAPDGSHFLLPDLRGRAAVGAGAGAGLTARALGASLGEEAHVLTAAELAPHSHNGSGTTGAGNSKFYRNVYDGLGNGSASNHQVGWAGGPPYADHNDPNWSNSDHTHNYSFTTDGGNGLSGAAHNTMPPGLVLNYIIKT